MCADPVVAEVVVPVPATDLLSGQALGAGESTSLSAWDVRVFVERTDPVRDDAADNRR